MPLDVYNEIHHLPDPEPLSHNKDKFKKFDDIYGKDASKVADKYLPSKNAKNKEHAVG